MDLALERITKTREVDSFESKRDDLEKIKNTYDNLNEVVYKIRRVDGSLGMDDVFKDIKIEIDKLINSNIKPFWRLLC